MAASAVVRCGVQVASVGSQWNSRLAPRATRVADGDLEEYRALGLFVLTPARQRGVVCASGEAGNAVGDLRHACG
ncbi:hypothetical protein BN6_57120 [Saccharothrix espanaensis DSM 44229]|uniref:Uncharacterized protein n=1 Tax=Saccharothrix espanaensis (strain ATCC 51144 / DSM 44229 / JCM 9112 / NBRC 15066 / NRRL 15764) TaxID=1179773 RepID=K0JYF3_SACES|nr:hypothetical protein BN6_57120 [Saccharothrix espanaensis DSM 44229]